MMTLLAILALVYLAYAALGTMTTLALCHLFSQEVTAASGEVMTAALARFPRVARAIGSV